jgi:hypothetical protein
MDKSRQFWPHSNFTPLTIGLYLHDVDGARDHGGPPAAPFLTQISHHDGVCGCYAWVGVAVTMLRMPGVETMGPMGIRHRLACL